MAASFEKWFATVKLVSTAGIALLWYCSSGVALAEQNLVRNEVTLYAGEAKVQNAPGPLSRIAVGDGKVLGVKIVAQQELVMIGEKPGDPSIHLWMADGSQRDIAV